MPSSLKTIKLYGKGSVNPPKVALVLTLLDIPFESVSVPVSVMKEPEYTSINPNGRIPSIYDPNTDLTLWESGAIVEYLIEKYDVEHKFSFAPGSKESYWAKQWFFYQATGQGPYYGQSVVFKKFQPIPEAAARYVKEINRVSGVLEGWLAKQRSEYGNTPGFDGPWLVANKFTYADLAFIIWQTTVGMVLTKEEYSDDNFPEVKEWLERMNAKPKVGSAVATHFGPTEY